MKIVLKRVRVAFLECFQAKSVNNGEPRFSVTGIIEPGSDNAKLVEAAIAKVAEEKWKGDAKKIFAELTKKGKVCYSTEEKTNSSGKVYTGFEGKCWISCASPTRPEVRDRDGKTPLVEADGRPYSGCVCSLIVDLWPQDNQYGKRINAKLLGVQFMQDGEAFAGGATVGEDDFESVEDDAMDLV